MKGRYQPSSWWFWHRLRLQLSHHCSTPKWRIFDSCWQNLMWKILHIIYRNAKFRAHNRLQVGVGHLLQNACDTTSTASCSHVSNIEMKPLTSRVICLRASMMSPSLKAIRFSHAPPKTTHHVFSGHIAMQRLFIPRSSNIQVRVDDLIITHSITQRREVDSDHSESHGKVLHRLPSRNMSV